VPEKSCETAVTKLEVPATGSDADEPPPYGADTIITEPPLEYDYAYPPSRKVITYNKERIARLKRCFACLARRAEEFGAEDTPPITPANLTLCIGAPITADHLRTLSKRGIIEEAGTGRSSPFSSATNPEAIFTVSDLDAVPYKAGQTCNYDNARYRQILETRKPASLAILENIVSLPPGIETFRRADLIKEARVTTDQVRDFIAKFTEANYITLVDARSRDYAVTSQGQAFFAFTRKMIRVRTDNKAYYTEFNPDRIKKVLFRKSLSPAEQTLFDRLPDIDPPYSATDIVANHPFTRSTVRSLFGKLEAEQYLERSPRPGKSLYFRPTATGYIILESEEEALRAEEQLLQREAQRRQRLIQHLLDCEFLRPSESPSPDNYRLGTYSTRFSHVQVQAYLHANNLSPFVYAAITNESLLTEMAKQVGSTIVALSNIVASDIATAPRAIDNLDASTRTVLQNILKCITCMQDRGVHQEGAVVATGDLLRCVGGSKRLTGVALRVLSEQDNPPVIRDPRRKRHVRYRLASRVPSAEKAQPDGSCQKITPLGVVPDRTEIPPATLEATPEPAEQYPLLKQTKERLQQLGILNDDHILSALQQCLDKQLLVVKKVIAEDPSQAVLRNPTYDRQTKSYITYNAKLAALSPVIRRAVAHHLGIGLILHGQAEDPRILKHAVGLASTDSLDDYARKIIAALS